LQRVRELRYDVRRGLFEKVTRRLDLVSDGPLQQLGLVEPVVAVDLVRRQPLLVDPLVNRLLGDVKDLREVADGQLHDSVNSSCGPAAPLPLTHPRKLSFSAV